MPQHGPRLVEIVPLMDKLCSAQIILKIMNIRANVLFRQVTMLFLNLLFATKNKLDRIEVKSIVGCVLFEVMMIVELFSFTLPQALISGAELVETSFEEYDETLKPKYTLTPLNGSEEIVCTCINDQWETTFEVNLDANLSIGYVGGDVTNKQPPWLMELDFICR